VRQRVVKDTSDRYDASMVKECPMCGEFMRLHSREVVTRIPGTSQEVKRTEREWVCPECDYFEEEEDDSVKDDTPESR